MTIMIVEDNSRFREAIITFLRSDLPEFATIYQCADGPEAIETYALHRPDWTIMDIKLTTLDGFATAKRIRLMDGAARIVFLTQFNEAVYQEAARELGAIAFVSKDEFRKIGSVLRSLTLRSDESHNGRPNT